MARTERRRRIFAEINIVPFTDVLLVLLVIFMVTSPLLVQGRIPVKLPRVASAPVDQSPPLTLALGLDGALSLDDAPLKPEELPLRLAEAIKARPDKMVVIRADRSASHGRVVELMEQARLAGAERLGIATEVGR